MNKLEFSFLLFFFNYFHTHTQKGKELANAVHDGIIVANQSLVLQNVSRIRMGQYTCVASNSEGDGESNPVQLDIHCKHFPLFHFPFFQSLAKKIMFELKSCVKLNF